MTAQLITGQAEFEDLCRRIREAGLVAFDTEFVSDQSWRPELGLLQLATSTETAAVDPLEVRDLSPWWELMGDGDTTVVVHGGQAEVRFCLVLADIRPQKLVDVQIAEGLRSRSYPLSYANLVRRVTRKNVRGRETRTDWLRRPLSDRQVHYALEDVRHVLSIWDTQRRDLNRRGRLEWSEAEFTRLINESVVDLKLEPWRRLPGIHRMTPRELAVAAEVAHWREQEARSRNIPARRVLRDDLVIDLVRRQPQSREDVLATRDMNRGNFKRGAASIVECVNRAMAMPEDQLPQPPPPAEPERGQDEETLGKLLSLALANRCAEEDVALPLVGTARDLRQLVRMHVNGEKIDPPPKLTEGWRAEVCGKLLVDVLDGRISVRVADPESPSPLRFEPA